MEDAVNALIFLISKACPVGCEYCCLPHDGHKLSVSEMSAYIHEVKKRTPSLIHQIGITGGEPFLFFEEMMEVAKIASENRLPLTTITSANWAKSYNVAFERLSKLQRLGLVRLNLSADPTHQQQVPLEYVKNALKAAVELNLHGDIIGTFNDLRSSVKDHLGQEPPQGYRFLEKLVAPFGRAKKIVLNLKHYKKHIGRLEKVYCYKEVGHDIVICPDGKVLPCCSTANSENNLIFGNVRNGDKISSLIQKITSSFLLRIIKRESFSELKKITIKYFPESTNLWPDHRNVYGPCSYCVKVFSDTTLRMMVMEALMREEPHYLARFIKRYTPRS